MPDKVVKTVLLFFLIFLFLQFGVLHFDQSMTLEYKQFAKLLPTF